MSRFHITDEGALHKYRTEVPNTVVRGLKSRPLSLYAKWLYVYLKSVAGECGECWQSSETLAQGSGMSQGKVSGAKKELMAAKLIGITKGNGAKHESDKLRILDIWDANMREFSGSCGEPEPSSSHEVEYEKAPQDETLMNEQPGSPHEGAGSYGEGERALLGGPGSCGESNRVHDMKLRRTQDLRKEPPLSLPTLSLSPISDPQRRPTAARNPPKARTTADTNYSRGFTQFWQGYPSERRIAKAHCYAIWKRAGLEARTSELLTKLTALCATQQWQDPKTVPTTQTWFNQQRWEDDAPMPTRHNGRLTVTL